MATASVTSQPEVVAYGGAREDYYNFTDAEAIGEGDLIRITSGGTIKLAEVNNGSIAGAVHGIALEDGTTAGVAIKVLLFADDTYVKIQCIDSLAPSTLKVGLVYTLEDGTNVWGITSTTTNPVATVVALAGTSQPWHVARGGWDEAVGTANNSVIVKFTNTILDGAKGA
jgi:hypothetical protein